jgi:hypothetical protein
MRCVADQLFGEIVPTHLVAIIADREQLLAMTGDSDAI